MCGLCGWYDKSINQEIDRTIIKRMGAKLNNRGPDSSGLYINKNISIMHKRLIIIDPLGGDQPMYLNFKNESYVIAYNGELYNTEEIRDELKTLGHTFKGHSDTEVLLHSYAEWEEGCLKKLNGIYAFAVWKEKEHSLFLARDRIGVKPMYYYLYQDGIIFGSEVKSILENPKAKPIIGLEGIYEIMLLGPGKINGSALFKDIKELMPGQYIKYINGNIKSDYYWTLKAVPHEENLRETIEHTRYLVKDAIIRQMVSDVPLACFLSGGLDSSIICKVASDFYKGINKQLTTYSVDYLDNKEYFVKNPYQPDMDAKYIKLMVDYTNSDHTDIVLNNLDLAYALKEATEAREMPGMADIDSSLLLFCSEIRKRNKVCISGECADEIFGGYPWYHREELLYRDTFPWSNSITIRKKLINQNIIKGDMDEYVREQYLKTVDSADYLPSENRSERRYREMFKLNLDWFMQTLLIRSDRMSSYNGLEVRVPYCDHRLVEYAYNMPWEYKSLSGREKGILREAFKDIIPSDIVYRKKSPYPKTFNPVFLDYVKNRAKMIIMDNTNPINEIIDKDYVLILLDQKDILKEPWYGQLMRLPQIYAYIIQLDSFIRDFNVVIDL